ncbi:MAG: hypothetical protein DMG96_12450, partial [Acidobacteria bacterium]
LMIFVDIGWALYFRPESPPSTAASHSASADIQRFPADRWNHYNALRAVQERIGDRILRFLGNCVQQTGCSLYT